MIPDFNHSHVLPPFIGDGPTAASDISPYRGSMLEVTQRFASLPGRRRLIEGLLNYRADLAALGFVRGFQWLDGSFAEDVEAHEQRPPNDIDIVTFAFSPAGLSSTQVTQLLQAHSCYRRTRRFSKLPRQERNTAATVTSCRWTSRQKAL